MRTSETEGKQAALTQEEVWNLLRGKNYPHKICDEFIKLHFTIGKQDETGSVTSTPEEVQSELCQSLSNKIASWGNAQTWEDENFIPCCENLTNELLVKYIENLPENLTANLKSALAPFVTQKMFPGDSYEQHQSIVDNIRNQFIEEVKDELRQQGGELAKEITTKLYPILFEMILKKARSFHSAASSCSAAARRKPGN